MGDVRCALCAVLIACIAGLQQGSGAGTTCCEDRGVSTVEQSTASNNGWIWRRAYLPRAKRNPLRSRQIKQPTYNIQVASDTDVTGQATQA